MGSLERLYAEHDGNVSQRWSSYLPILERTLGPRRDEPLRLLEVGVQNGGSLELWARYLPNAELLVGNDIDPRCGALTFADPRIQVVVGDIATAEVQRSVRARSERFDVIIDDGSHRSADIIAAFVALLPALEVGGVYLIEDLHCSYYGSFGGGLFEQGSALGFLRRVVDVINLDHWGLDLGPAELLQPLVEAPLSQEFLVALERVASMEFHDSMCVIRTDDASRPRLGNRIVAGKVAAVDPGPLAEAGRPLVGEQQLDALRAVDPIDQERTIAATRAELRATVHRTKELEAELAAVWQRLERILASPSYRVMNGPRRLFRALLRRGVSGSS